MVPARRAATDGTTPGWWADHPESYAVIAAILGVVGIVCVYILLRGPNRRLLPWKKRNAKDAAHSSASDTPMAWGSGDQQAKAVLPDRKSKLLGRLQVPPSQYFKDEKAAQRASSTSDMRVSMYVADGRSSTFLPNTAYPVIYSTQPMASQTAPPAKQYKQSPAATTGTWTNSNHLSVASIDSTAVNASTSPMKRQPSPTRPALAARRSSSSLMPRSPLAQNNPTLPNVGNPLEEELGDSPGSSQESAHHSRAFSTESNSTYTSYTASQASYQRTVSFNDHNYNSYHSYNNYYPSSPAATRKHSPPGEFGGMQQHHLPPGASHSPSPPPHTLPPGAAPQHAYNHQQALRRPPAAATQPRPIIQTNMHGQAPTHAYAHARHTSAERRSLWSDAWSPDTVENDPYAAGPPGAVLRAHPR